MLIKIPFENTDIQQTKESNPKELAIHCILISAVLHTSPKQFQDLTLELSAWK